jgi:hypothetical protein
VNAEEAFVDVDVDEQPFGRTERLDVAPYGASCQPVACASEPWGS